jgi:hypothetical protein
MTVPRGQSSSAAAASNVEPRNRWTSASGSSASRTAE